MIVTKGGSNKIPWELKVTFTDSKGIFQLFRQKNHLQVISWLVQSAIWVGRFLPILERDNFSLRFSVGGGGFLPSHGMSRSQVAPPAAGTCSCRWGARVAMRGYGPRVSTGRKKRMVTFSCLSWSYPSLKRTASLPLKIDDWKTIFRLPFGELACFQGRLGQF